MVTHDTFQNSNEYKLTGVHSYVYTLDKMVPIVVFQILFDLKKIQQNEISVEEPESLEYPAPPIHRVKAEAILPSPTAVFKFGVTCLASFVAYSTYFFLVGWRGALLYRWLRWRYSIDIRDYF